MSATQQVTLDFGLSKQEAKNMRSELLALRRKSTPRFWGLLRYTADLMKEIADQLDWE